jgi:hypothetical protein
VWQGTRIVSIHICFTKDELAEFNTVVLRNKGTGICGMLRIHSNGVWVGKPLVVGIEVSFQRLFRRLENFEAVRTLGQMLRYFAFNSRGQPAFQVIANESNRSLARHAHPPNAILNKST